MPKMSPGLYGRKLILETNGLVHLKATYFLRILTKFWEKRIKIKDFKIFDIFFYQNSTREKDGFLKIILTLGFGVLGSKAIFSPNFLS